MLNHMCLAALAALPCSTLMSARITSWADNCAYPTIMLRKSLGQAGEIESETAAILEMENIR